MKLNAFNVKGIAGNWFAPHLSNGIKFCSLGS